MASTIERNDKQFFIRKKILPNKDSFKRMKTEKAKNKMAPTKQRNKKIFIRKRIFPNKDTILKMETENPKSKMATSMQLKSKFFMRNKLTPKKDANRQTADTLKQLLKRPNITIKKTVLLENYKAQMSPKNQTEPAQRNSVTAKSLVTQKSPIKKVQKAKSLLIKENKEYYPDKVKRNIQTKKIVLRPKHNYEVLATTNKRKRTTPHKELVSLETRLFQFTNSDPDSGLSIEDLIIAADEERMNDEDFMEILTCPSPVWWEGGEEDDSITFQEGLEKNYNWNDCDDIVQNGLITCNSINGNSLKSDINFFKKFVRKRTKLENVLGNIKFKKTKQDRIDLNTNIGNSGEKIRKNSVGGISDESLNEELLNSLENIHIPIKELISDCEDAINQNDVIIIKNSDIHVENDKPNQKSKIKKRVTRKVKKVDELEWNGITKHNGLETNGIEIRQVGNCDELGKKTNLNDDIIESNGIELEKLKNCDQLINTTEIADNDYEIDIIGSNEIKNEMKCDKFKNAIIEIVTDEIRESNGICVPEKLPPLTKNPFQSINNTESPKSIDSSLSRTTNTSISEFDSISDTNVKFLDEDEHEAEKSNAKITIKNANLMRNYKKFVTEKIKNFDAEDGIKINFVNKSPSGEISFKMNSIVKKTNKIKVDRKKLNEMKKKTFCRTPRKTNYRKTVICKKDI